MKIYKSVDTLSKISRNDTNDFILEWKRMHNC